MLDKLSVLGRPSNFDNNRARAYCACGRCGLGLFEQFFLVCLSCFLTPCPTDGPIETEILSQRVVKPKSTNLVFAVCCQSLKFKYIIKSFFLF